MEWKKRILCIGAGYVGGPTMAMIACKCPAYSVTVVDIDSRRIDQWNSDRLPIFEPGLDEIVRQVRGKNLFFSTAIDEGIRQADIIFVSVNTPTKTYGAGKGMAADLQYWEKTARQIRNASRSSKIVIEKSTLPVKTAQAMERILNAANDGRRFEVLSNPEFLAEGTAMRDLENPDRVLIGSRQSPAGLAACRELVEIYAHWVDRERILTANIWSSELSKLVANAFLAQRISSINSISALCEKTDADIVEVSRAVGTDSRIGSRFLNASIGFGGSCFKKDILNLIYICRSYGLEPVADYWEGVLDINTYQLDRFFMTMLAALFNTIAGKKICLFGFAFKANTGDTRESPAIALSRRLLAEQAELVISDPEALENAARDLADCTDRLALVEDPYAAVEGCCAMAVVTEWDLYRELDYERIYALMDKPAFVFDGRNILDHRRLFEIGFNVYPIGKAAMTHFDEVI
jgi:UDPglucose 6-dehydrogenase